MSDSSFFCVFFEGEKSGCCRQIAQKLHGQIVKYVKNTETILKTNNTHINSLQMSVKDDIVQLTKQKQSKQMNDMIVL